MARHFVDSPLVLVLESHATGWARDYQKLCQEAIDGVILASLIFTIQGFLCPPPLVLEMRNYRFDFLGILMASFLRRFMRRAFIFPLCMCGVLKVDSLSTSPSRIVM